MEAPIKKMFASNGWILIAALIVTVGLAPTGFV
jgi:hypothetical protein